MGARGVLLGTNYQAIIRPLQWFVVILIFLFFLRVVRAVFVETSPGARAADRVGASSSSSPWSGSTSATTSSPTGR